MLKIATDIVPHSDLAYVAFRISFRETLERLMLARQMGQPVEGFGYLAEVPFFRAVPGQVQLDTLARTWKRLVSRETFEADLLDESVIYATGEAAAGVVEAEPEEVSNYLARGPRNIDVVANADFAAQLRGLHLGLSNDGDFLVLSQFEDMPPDEARWFKRKFQLDESRLQPMFDLLGRWHLSPEFGGNLRYLLTPGEIRRVYSLLEQKVHKQS